MARQRYHKLRTTLERDGNIILTMTLEEFRMTEIHRALNEVRYKEVYELAIRDGLREEEAHALGEASALSLRTIYAVRKKMLDRLLVPANAITGRAILEKQLGELEGFRLKFRQAEARCWREFNKRSASPVIDVTPGGSDADLSEADPRWIERIEALIWKQVQITEKQAAIRGALSLGAPSVDMEKAGSGDEAAAKSLKLWEVQTLYREDCFAMGLGASETRTRLQTIQGFIEGKMPSTNRDGSPGEGRVTFRVVGLEVEEGGE